MIIIRNISNFLRKESFCFVTFIVSSIITFSCFLFLGNYCMNLYKDYSKYDEDSRTYRFEIKEKVFHDKMEDFLQSWEEKIQHIYGIIVNEDGELVVTNIFGDFPADIKIQYGRYFTEKELIDSKNVVIMPNDLYRYNSDTGFENIRKYTIGDSYFVNEIEYEIIGIGTENYYMIPYSTIDESNSIDYIAVATKEIMRKKEKEIFCSALSKAFEVKEIELPREKQKFFESAYLKDLFLVISLLGVGILNLSFLYCYILEIRKKQIKIFRLCGCSYMRIILQSVGEILILITGAYVVAVLCVKWGILPYIKTLNFLFQDSLTSLLVLFIYICCIVIFSLFLIPIVNKILRIGFSENR